MMKQRTSEADLHFFFTEEEKEVAAILLDLQFCKIQKGVRGCWPLEWATEEILVWGRKRKRSVLAVASSSSPSPSPGPFVQRRRTCAQIECGMKTGGQVKVEATSPATPLAFSPSESDDNKSKHCHRKSSKKRSRDELLKTVNELTDNKIALSRELERVQRHYDSILAYNRQLKAMKNQVNSSSVNSSRKREESQFEKIRNYYLGPSLSRNSCYQISLVPVALPPPPRLQQPQQPSPSAVVDPVVAGEQFQQQQHQQYRYVVHHHQITTAAAPPVVSSNSGGLDRVGEPPVGSDLMNNHNNNNNNTVVCNEESLRFRRVEDSFRPLLDYSRVDQKAKYAEARWERRMKRKFKHYRK